MNEMTLHLKNRIKQFSPPILLNKVKDYKNYWIIYDPNFKLYKYDWLDFKNYK